MENTTSEKKSFVCVKCGNTTYASSRMTGAPWGVLANMKYSRSNFITISCKKCGYTELYKT